MPLRNSFSLKMTMHTEKLKNATLHYYRQKKNARRNGKVDDDNKTSTKTLK